MLERRAYCVAENFFCVSRSSRTLKAAVPMPIVRFSTKLAVYITGRFTPICATRT